MNRFESVEFFYVEMALQVDMALDQLNYIIDTIFPSIGKFEPFDRYTTLQSLYTELDHQLEDGLMGQQKSDCMRFIGSCDNYKITVCLLVHVFLFKMSRLIAKGIIRSYSMRQQRIGAAVKPFIGIISNCDVCGGLMFNALRYMHMNDA